MRKVNLVTLMDPYNNDEKYRDTLEAMCWPDGIYCIRCGVLDIGEIESRNQYSCRACDYRFNVTARTIMHDSHLPLRVWFLAIFLMCQSKKGMSAHQLWRTLGIGSYKTAWYLRHWIREAMGNDPLRGPTIVGIVEVDETLIGGKDKGKGKGCRGQKTRIAGAIQRGGDVRLERIENVKQATLHSFIARNVRDEVEAIYTDKLARYFGIEDEDTHHGTVNHSAEEWIVGDVQVNSIENVWSLSKRSITEAFHKVSKKHFDRYLEELEWRFNSRDNDHIFRDTLERIMNTGAMPYRKLVA